MLYYVLDPMCSWCYAFAPELLSLRTSLQAQHPGLEISLVMGGLAPDSDVPMDPETQEFIQQSWQRIRVATGVRFNFDFWTECEPRRSTYPACRAVIAAEALEPGSGWYMLDAIQQAYYREAKNPSDLETLDSLGATILPDSPFAKELRSPRTEQALQENLGWCQERGVRGFPSLLWEEAGKTIMVMHGYMQAEQILPRVQSLLRA